MKRLRTYAALLLFCTSSLLAFSPVPTFKPSYSSCLFSLKQRKDESSADYFRRLSAAAQDPKSFEEESLKEDEEDVPKPARKGYQRIEEWDAETKLDASWEEKVQFDGLRNGNRFAQNNILLKHLNNGW